MFKLRHLASFITLILISVQPLVGATSPEKQYNTSTSKLREYKVTLSGESQVFENEKNFSPPKDPPPKTTQGSGTH